MYQAHPWSSLGSIERLEVGLGMRVVVTMQYSRFCDVFKLSFHTQPSVMLVEATYTCTCIPVRTHSLRMFACNVDSVVPLTTLPTASHIGFYMYMYSVGKWLP